MDEELSTKDKRRTDRVASLISNEEVHNRTELSEEEVAEVCKKTIDTNWLAMKRAVRIAVREIVVNRSGS
jgi:uncharacterized protein YqeY